jgi:hypothetical protein
MKKSYVLCRKSIVLSDTFLKKNALNFQFAELWWNFAESTSTFAELYIAISQDSNRISRN